MIAKQREAVNALISVGTISIAVYCINWYCAWNYWRYNTAVAWAIGSCTSIIAASLGQLLIRADQAPCERTKSPAAVISICSILGAHGFSTLTLYGTNGPPFSLAMAMVCVGCLALGLALAFRHKERSMIKISLIACIVVYAALVIGTVWMTGLKGDSVSYRLNFIYTLTL